MFTAFHSRFMTPTALVALISILLLLWSPAEAMKVRVKDICSFQDQQQVDLIGYGLVIGLDGTGDGNGSQFTTQSLVNMMQRMGLTVDVNRVKVKNVASVIVTSRISSMQTEGSTFDITVSSLGDASSLQGGTLLLTPLSDATGIVHAVAQGPVSIGGFNVQVDDNNKIVNNYTLVGRVPNGAKITNALEPKPGSDQELFLALNDPDITTSQRIADRINITYGLTAWAINGGTVKVVVPDSLMYPSLRMRFISDIGHMQIVPDNNARVIINERTGTIVAGEHVTIEPVAIAHGTITVSVQSTPLVSQPEPFSQGETMVVQQPTLSVTQEPARVVKLDGAVYLSDIANALNRIGATPRDIVAIFQAIKQAGALHAELVII